MRKILSTLMLLTISLSSIAQVKTYVYCGTLIDGISDKPRKEVTVIIEGNKIVDIQNGYAKMNKKDTYIDLKDKTVMPGWFDMHVHIEGEMGPNSYIEEFTANEADIAFHSTVYAKRTLMAGFTTVRDLGGTGVNTSLRNAINQGLVEGPRIYSAGKAIGTTGGHADPTNGYRKDLMGDPGPKEGVINSYDEAKKAVRQRYKNGADVIKITSTGGVLSVAKDGQGPQFTMDELRGIVEAAKDYGFVTAAHAHGAEGMKRAVEAGINSIEHGTLMTEEVRQLMIKHETYYVPTITAGKYVAEKAEVDGFYPEIIRPKAREIGPKIQDTFAKAYKAGVKIAFGTDAGVFPHGENAKEFGYMVEAGMPPMEAIKSTTMEAAKLLRVDDKLGSIEKGKIADLVATDKNPLEDIHTTEDVAFVMKAGVVYKNE
ncbi:MAG: amidohydrolase family protein [Cyclobacteriaceae bacterium]|nr:amidohydrolase family protein [Cyclobacteriaceae bacterium]